MPGPESVGNSSQYIYRPNRSAEAVPFLPSNNIMDKKPPSSSAWNPYVDDPSKFPSYNPTDLPHYAKQDQEIQQLCDLYQQQLVELNACHSLLQADQERLSQMLLP